ncbi:class I SAM-dependent rRNA methyltransferase [Pelagibius sp. Alg239-R121]|uniref:class I SAM-dependent rRNA methyltransferase n=1 Tax=Pelagibius sp. Alg239-R121 TaxID=2993448 RepID=UPI0024A70875|nr:class I SAM-dependent rRNA methyltransferase [Pelagibius sp. Alg239-R121]
MPAYPELRLKPHVHKRVLHGSPWIYSNEIEMDGAARSIEPGEIVRLMGADGHALGVAMFNRHSLIAARIISRDPKVRVDVAYLTKVLNRALQIRERLFDAPYYRLIHAEADGLPGVIIDRFGDVLVAQLNSAGADRFGSQLLEALAQAVAPTTVVLRNDTPARQTEGLASLFEVPVGQLTGPIEVLENGARYFADLESGQKTGWFYDQRINRSWAAKFAKGHRVLDCYSFSGGFTVQSALAGAQEVIAIDRSQTALDLAAKAAAANGVADSCRFVKREALTQMADLAKEKENFGLVIADPPAFVKSKKNLAQGLKGYRKVARLAASLVAPEGALFIASCSHHADPVSFAEQVKRGLNDAGREGRILYSGGAGPDHPVHPALPETSYLKAMLLALN